MWMRVADTDGKRRPSTFFEMGGGGWYKWGICLKTGGNIHLNNYVYNSFKNLYVNIVSDCFDNTSDLFSTLAVDFGSSDQT